MTLPRLYALTDYWKNFPPVHLLLAGFVGHKPKKIKNESQNFEQFMDFFEQSGGQLERG